MSTATEPKLLGITNVTTETHTTKDVLEMYFDRKIWGYVHRQENHTWTTPDLKIECVYTRDLEIRTDYSIPVLHVPLGWVDDVIELVDDITVKIKDLNLKAVITKAFFDLMKEYSESHKEHTPRMELNVKESKPYKIIKKNVGFFISDQVWKFVWGLPGQTFKHDDIQIKCRSGCAPELTGSALWIPSGYTDKTIRMNENDVGYSASERRSFRDLIDKFIAAFAELGKQYRAFKIIVTDEFDNMTMF